MAGVVPQPLQAAHGEGAFALDGARILAGTSPAERHVAEAAAAVLGLAVGVDPAGAAARTVRLTLDDGAGPEASTSPERYSLEVGTERVDVRAATPEGLFRAVTTLAQLVRRVPGEIPTLVVHDAPRYGWRGLSLDVARHFYEPDVVERVVDVMARYKLSVLHLHLTDDQGWRIETPSRPRLTEESGKGEVGDGPGGFFTQAELRRIEAYAADRFVRVVPEIDMPGHINAATHAYGELVPGGVATDTYHGTEVGFSRLTFDLPGTEPFLRDVFTDLARVTAGEHVHIGGDEVLTMERPELEKFVALAHEVVTASGKKVVGWQEIAQAVLPAGTLVQYWDVHKTELGHIVEAARRGARVVMSPADRIYLDMKYTPDFPLGTTWGDSIAPVELRDSYDWEPESVIPGLPPESIEGVEAAVWTEFIATPDELFTMLLPRLAAAAEIAWTAADRRGWESFAQRVAGESAWWREQGVAFHESPGVDWA